MVCFLLLCYSDSLKMLFSVLMNNLWVHVRPMYLLYCILKDHEGPPTPEEIAIASGKKQLDGHAESNYLKKLEKASENIKKAFENQQAQAAVSDNLINAYISLISWQGPWDQEKFEQLLMEWIISCDQPFDQVEKPEFATMMNFTHHTGGPLKILQCNAIKQCVMKMGEETIDGVRGMFSVWY